MRGMKLAAERSASISSSKPRANCRERRSQALVRLLSHLPLRFLRCTLTSVLNDKDADEVHELVYREYLKRNYCKSNAIQKHFCLHAILRSSQTFVMKQRSKTAGTITVVEDSPAGLPLEDLYGEEVEQLRRSGRRLVEFGMLALDSNLFRSGSYSLRSVKKMFMLFHLFRGAFAFTHRILGATDIIIVVHPRHERLYNFIGFEKMGPVRSYEGAEGNPALPMILPVAHLANPAQRQACARFAQGDINLDDLRKHHEFNVPSIIYRLLGNPKAWDSASLKAQAALLFDHPALWPYEPILSRTTELHVRSLNLSLEQKERERSSRPSEKSETPVVRDRPTH